MSQNLKFLSTSASLDPSPASPEVPMFLAVNHFQDPQDRDLKDFSSPALEKLSFALAVRADNGSCKLTVAPERFSQTPLEWDLCEKPDALNHHFLRRPVVQALDRCARQHRPGQVFQAVPRMARRRTTGIWSSLLSQAEWARLQRLAEQEQAIYAAWRRGDGMYVRLAGRKSTEERPLCALISDGENFLAALLDGDSNPTIVSLDDLELD